MNRKVFTKSLILKLIGLFILGIIALIVLIKFAPQILELVQDTQKFADYLNSFGSMGKVIFVLFEILQVIIALIPGDLFHISAGLIYGMPQGFLLAYAGELVGALTAFGIAKFFGAEVVKKFVSDKMIKKTSNLLNSAKGTFGIVVICLIPVIPKDVLVYVAGLTPVKPIRFLTVFLLSRIPDIYIKASGGKFIYEGNYTGLIIVIVLLLLMIGGGLLFRKKLAKKQDQDHGTGN